jgi:LuxR family transcriptional regulator, maltose regulon positive regulatory protein
MMTEQYLLKHLTTIDYEPSEHFVIKQAQTFLLAGKCQACVEFLDLQPVEIIESSAALLIYQATAMLFNESPQEAIELILNRAEQIGGNDNHAGEIAALRAIIQSYTGDPGMGIKLSQIALGKINNDNTYFRNIVERNLGIAYTIQNDLKNANIWFEKLLMSSCKLEDWGGILAAYNYLTYIRKVQGRLRDADVIYRKALAFISKQGLEHLPHAIKLIAGYGQLLLYWHRVDDAKIYFNKAIRLAAESDILYGYTAYHFMCEAFLKENDLQSALGVLNELRHQVDGRQDFYKKFHNQHTQALETRIHIAAGRIDKGLEWLASSGFDEIPPHKLFQYYGYGLGQILPTAAHIYNLMGMHDLAIQVLKAVIPKYLHQGANSYLIRSLAALAIAYNQKGQFQKAEKTILHAVSLGAPEKNIGDFLFFGRSLIPIINLVACHPSAQDFSAILLRHLEVFNPCSHNLPPLCQQNPALSPRELDVLQLIASGLTNQQIANALFLSNNTIKSHSVKIYRKLKVDNRNQAVSTARSMGLLTKNKIEPNYRYFKMTH